ncbi:MAG: hypothetical protein HUJ94_03805 [Bacteroidales bacterium]|nr:hypothetical protein [Bacteroidales bacterium]
MKNRILMTAAALVLGHAGLSAQNLNPTVEVTRQFEGKLSEIVKQSPQVCIPDTLRRFNLDFDYSVFSKPYSGSYDFNPYLLDNRPLPEKLEETSLWLRAGAGYSIYPTLDFVWNPKKLRNDFRMDIYGSHHSYVGKYRAVGYTDQVLDKTGSLWDGYDMDSRLGVDGRYDWSGGYLSFDLAYQGFHSMEEMLRQVGKSNYNSAEASLRIVQKDDSRNHVVYGGSLSYRFVNDKLDCSPDPVAGNEFEFDITGGYSLNRRHAFLAELKNENAFYSYLNCPYAGSVSINPKYVFSYDRWHINLGAKFSNTYSGDQEMPAERTGGRHIYPDLKVSFAAVWDGMEIYAKAGGGDNINSYSSIKKNNHFAASWLDPEMYMDNSFDLLDSRLGIAGSMFSRRLSYDIGGGYRKVENHLFMPVYFNGEHTSAGLPCYGDMSAYNASARLSWKSERLAATAGFEWEAATPAQPELPVLLPSEYKADASFSYRWGARVTAGLKVEYASAMKGLICGPEVLLTGDEESELPEEPGEVPVLDARVPYFVDLGFDFDFKVNSRLSLWVSGGNLLNMTIQRTPLVAERGINFTIGATLRL